MTVIGRTNHAFFFDGVSDSIIVPDGAFKAVGKKNPEGEYDVRELLGTNISVPHAAATSGNFQDGLTIEAWVTPDCGGTIIEKPGQYKLTVGNVDTPGPAVFQVNLAKDKSQEYYEVRTGTQVSNTRYEGTVYPISEFGGIHDYYNRFDTSTYGLATDMNRNHRPLLHVIATVRPGRAVELYINGALMARKEIDDDGLVLCESTSHTYIGGKGGQFRGVMESIHLTSQFSMTMVDGNAPLKTNGTTLLYRFEEPISPIETVYTFSASSGSYDSNLLGSLTLSQTDAKSLAKTLTGNTVNTGTVDFTAKPYSSGLYKIQDVSTGTVVNRTIAHVPYNLLINPGSINPNTKKPNQTPPERVRLHSINVDTGVLTVSSIHLDQSNDTNAGLIGLITETRTADSDNHFVVIGADLLIDSATGNPYSPPHYNSQIIDRTGQMILDESGFDTHGFVYSSRLATTTDDTDNPFAVTWPTNAVGEPVNTNLQIGHSGRHTHNHVSGHDFLRMLPKANDEIIDQSADGSADVIDIIYDEMHTGVDEQLSVNSRVDVYREFEDATINNFVNSSTATAVFNSYNGVSNSDVPAGKRVLLAIGGPKFDFRPFMLKGPCPQQGMTHEDDVRRFHLRPSSESRIALLHVPQLTTTNIKFAPYVEIHYNAVDLTGASMSGTNQPLLMVEKTVPACTVSTGAGSYIYDAIADSIASGKTLYAPGGLLEVNFANLSNEEMLKPHSLVGDVSEGYSADVEVDETLCPANYSVRAISGSANTTPEVVLDSVSTTGVHESVFNKLYITKKNDDTTLVDKGTYSRVEPDVVVGSPSNGQFDTGVTPSSTHIHEMFDIIDNFHIDSNVSNTALLIQPSDRRRSNQLVNLRTEFNTSKLRNGITPMYLMSRARIRAIEETEGDRGYFTTINCIGLSDVAVSRSINFAGRGSPESHVVKEIEPNSPVVTVTLGGPGQGAMDTKPVYQHSILAHETYSTRRAYAVDVSLTELDFSAGTGTITVVPLNNESTSMASWGTYGFPKYGRIYLPDGSSAKYTSKTGTSFTFAVAVAGSGDFQSVDGSEYTDIGSLLFATGFVKGESSGLSVTSQARYKIYNEPDFGSESQIENGSTVNDRMHQAMDDVSHDYQLGTQYASTRALAEVPVFSKQLFGPTIGPDNAFKMHIDATHTAHTYNPSPVGRRFKGVSPGDREAQSAYATTIANNEHVQSAAITKWDSTNSRIYIDNKEVFPAAGTSYDQYQGIDQLRYRKVFLANGEWAWYTNDPNSDGYLQLYKNGSDLNPYGFTTKFIEGLNTGTSVFVGGPLLDDMVRPMVSDEITPSSDFEDRDEYHYDAASIKTQGGNVDYGLRQYASAVEFKAGPESNPHAPRTSTRRAAAKVLSAEEYTLGTNLQAVVIGLSEEDMEMFPELGYDEMKDMPTGAGTLRYEVQYDDAGTTRVYQYHGRLKKLPLSSPVEISENSIVLVYYDAASAYPTSLQGKTITLARKCRNIIGTLPGSGTEISAGTTDATWCLYSELYDNLMIDTNIAITAYSLTARAYIEITNQTGKNLNNLHGLNIKKDDVVYYYVDDSTDKLRKLGIVTKVTEALSTNKQTIHLSSNAPDIPSSAKLAVWTGDYEDHDAVLNAKWLNPYANGGLRHGDTIWANMSFNNPHAVEGLFAKSRGVFNEARVWRGFDGTGELNDSPRDSIPLENFLIGDTCLETAQNYVQHVNKTIEENYKSLGLTVAEAPTVAYLDPYLSDADHARVLLYNVAHDKEFVAFQDIHMQVQTSPQATQLGWPKEVVENGGTSRTPLDKVNAAYGGSGPSPWTTQIDVTNGFLSQNPYIRSTQQSKFIESAYAHDLANRKTEDLLDSTSVADLVTDLPDDGRKIIGPRLYGKAHGHHVHTGYSYGGTGDGLRIDYSLTPRTDDRTVLHKVADSYHQLTRIPFGTSDSFIYDLMKYRESTANCTFRDPSTFFDTPDGTRVIPAFLCLKGIRSSSLDLSAHDESRLQHIPQWKDMDFVRRLSIDLGEVSQKDGVTNTLAGAEEVVRLINQHAALTAQTEGGSAHNPSPFWDKDNGDKGTHMGYIRAHIGREVEDHNGDVGYTIVIHSTVPGASGRNFCVWLDNSKGQSVYQPQFLVGHGGRWRNFWALPEEKEGENMHPAPMPLNKHGRPFAPITTLQQYVTTTESGEEIGSVMEFEDDSVLRAASDSISGKGHNSTSTESLDVKGSSSSLVRGLRTGTSSIARVNFGGLVASGVPGWAPNAGKWGFGKPNDKHYKSRYGSTAASSYSSYVPTADKLPDNIGNAPIYGFRLKDNVGRESGIRLVYKKSGDPFANENTVLPDTIEEEVCIFFDDRNVTEGGFTIGSRMHGSGEATGRSTLSGSSNATWYGNRWRGVPAPDSLSYFGITWTATNKVAAIAFDTAPFSTMTHDDKLGYFGFPRENGVFQVSTHSGVAGTVHTYTHRSGDKFFGVSPDIATASYYVTPVLNWTTLVTDELIAAATAAAINAGDEINGEGHVFDCRDMYAADGRTFGEWGISRSAIVIKAYSEKSSVTPLSQRFNASVHADQGIKAAHLEFGELEKTVRPTGATDWGFGTSRATTDSLIDSGRTIDCGYIPFTLLQIRSLSKGPNGNTATPVFVDSQNNPVSTSTWRENLKGLRFTRSSGDHILPRIDNPHVEYSQGDTSASQWYANNLHTIGDAFSLMVPDDQQTHSVGERKKLYFKDNMYATGYFSSTFRFFWEQDTQSVDWPDGDSTPTKGITVDSILSLYGDTSNTRQFDGLRSIGSVFSEPIVYFRGGKSSKDHSVPLFFGGGFSGVTLDVNDGTNNDYSTFYTHPYANGPTGVAGLQNANEISTSHAMLDCNAMFAFFPGAPLCNQHRGSITPPAFNKQNMLSPDLARGGANVGTTTSPAYTTGEVQAKPVPLVLRFPHPTARYEDATDGIDVDSKTTYLIFGPGQAFPFTREVADASGTANQKEPHPGRIVTSGNTWASVPLDESLSSDRQLFPNSIANEKGNFLPPTGAYYAATAGWHWRAVVNWETPAGYSWKGKWSQRTEHGRHYGQQFNDDTPYDISGTAQIGIDLTHIHPKMHTPTIGFGITMAADTVWHMDGGFHPGGHWMDNQITFNPRQPAKNFRVLSSNWERANQIHPTAFRTAGVLTGRILDYIGTTEAVQTTDCKNDYVVVDATRCQNGEELATVLGAAINAFPGAGALKSLGGTHMPSMGNSMRQDRYGWIDLGTSCTYTDDNGEGNFVETAASSGQVTKEQIPASGWIRLHAGNDTRFACYHSREILADSSNWKIRFFLAPNRIYGESKLEAYNSWETMKESATAYDPSISSSYKLFVWGKAGTIRFNNENVSSRDHMAQVHFSGIADAVDRTRPTGVIGWHGERYSYLNTLKMDKNTSGTGYAAGLGAYHPMLGFNPYGTAGSVMGAYSNVPVVAPMRGSPESTSTIDGVGDALGTLLVKSNFYSKLHLQTASGAGWDATLDTDAGSGGNQGYRFTDTDAAGNDNQWAYSSNYSTTLPQELTLPQGLYTNAFLVVSYECESSMIAKRDRDLIKCNGDWLYVKSTTSNPIQSAGTTHWDERFHGQDRFVAPANAGPNVEALIVDGTTVPVGDPTSANWASTTFSGCHNILHGAVSDDINIKNATPGLNKTGDLLFDLDHSVGSVLLESGDAERNTSADKQTVAHTTDWPATYWMGDVNGYQMYKDSAVHNFSVENVVWKRMDGGNLSLPAVNARGLGAVPWMTRVASNTAYTMGEKLFGNVRFSFETTNSAMMPIMQAQELAHPELMRKHPYGVQNVLTIPNEEVQFQSINVRDDTGQLHKIEGGSPLGTIIRGFRVPENRSVKGNAPALANSGNTPNLKVQLPNPDSIPGNIVVRSGFDPIQAYQSESMGSGGMHHADLNETHTGHLFDNSVAGPRMAPTYEDHNWERIDPVTYDSELGAWLHNEPLQTSYELHDRTLFFHVCKMGHSHTHRYPTVYTHTMGVETDTVSVTAWDASTSILTVDGTLNTRVFDAGFGTEERLGGRKFLRVYNPTTDEGVVCSYEDESDNTIPVVGDVDFATFMAAQTVTDLKVVPSYYVPGGSTRFFAARRLRDHAEVSGNSPDMAHTRYFAGDSIAYNAYSKPKMTPMPYPRMGHHYVTPTMPMMPGHWAHPAYQSLYKRHLADYNAELKTMDSTFMSDLTTSTNKKADITGLNQNIKALDAEVNFSGVNAAPSGPSDIHGGAFTLMFETGVKYDGYGILASSGSNAGDINELGGHSIVLEAAANYTLSRHFPDPVEVGAYQIVIQPNLFSNQLIGNHENATTQLTSQQVNTVIAIVEDSGSNKKGGLTLVLEREVGADVRGCEVFINEMMLDINPDHGSQFTNIPPLMTYNPLGVQLNETPSFTRRGFPYSTMFSDATPGYTLNIPWWSILHKEAPDDNAGIFTKLTHYAPENYYQLCRNGFGSIGKQLTINGYPSIYIDIYSKTNQTISLIPKTTVSSFNASTGTIQVANGNLFPMYSYFSPVVEYTAKNGQKYRKEFNYRSGHYYDVNKAHTLVLDSDDTDKFWTNLHNGAVLRLSDSYNSIPTGQLLKDKKRSIFANILPQIIEGNQDTNSKYVPDAFLCMWHPNLGRPNTYFSDSRTSFGANAIDKAGYNHLPEHFETIHYHDFSYAISTGPFDFLIQTPSMVGNRDGSISAGNSNHDAGGTNVMLSGFWPCGSRGGPQASDLGYYGYASASWNVHPTAKTANFSSALQHEWEDAGDDGSFSIAHGITSSSAAATKRRAYGYRFGVLQASNRPRYGTLPARMVYENTANFEGLNTTDASSGPLVQMETQDWGWAGNGSSSSTFPTTYVGVMERLTNFVGMLGHDKAENQVRYSDGRRMTRPFGTPLRTLRNPSQVQRDWWGDDVCKGITSLSTASQYYLVDWWGNERGEDVRRAPVRGFGIRPAWDCGDAYEYDRRNSRSPYDRIWNNGKPIFNMKGVANLSNGAVSVTTTVPRYGGTDNDINLHASTQNFDLVDVFAPTHSLRVGDMGGGRGVRYPTAFNEDVLTALSAPIHKTGVVLSHNTAEPLFGNGLLRPRDDVLQADEVKRGISAKLGIADDGLLTRDAVVSDKVETISGDSPHKTAISRASPRIGIDAETVEGLEQNHVVINTEAHSLHTDRNVGQRITLLGGSNLVAGASTLGDADYTNVSFARQAGGSPVYNVQKYSHTNPFRPYGGSYVLESENYRGYFDDTGWGVNNLTGSTDTTNPYQDGTWKTTNVRNNEQDSTVKFLVRPIRVLDKNHVEIYRSHDAVASSTPQYDQNYLRASAGGKYGVFVYEVANGRTTADNIPGSRSLPDGNGPYIPVFGSWDSAHQVPSSKGPKIPGTEATGFDKTSLASTLSTLVISENTLQHHKSDAPRRRQEGDTDDDLKKPDYSIKARFSQSLHNKGHKGDVTYGVSDHSGDGS